MLIVFVLGSPVTQRSVVVAEGAVTYMSYRITVGMFNPELLYVAVYITRDAFVCMCVFGLDYIYLSITLFLLSNISIYIYIAFIP